MGTIRFASLTYRIIRFWRFWALAAFAVSLVSCMGEGTDQVHGMLRVAFSSTAVCQAQSRAIQFRNVSGEEIVINGVTIAGGTDPEGNFKLLSATVGGAVTEASASILHDIRVPPNTLYSFQVSYVPHSENASHEAVLDVVYSAPKEGVVQIALSGTSTSRLASCADDTGGTTGGVGDLSGDMTITITRIALVSSQISAPVTTDEEQTVTPFNPVTVPVSFNGGTNSITLPEIDDDPPFALPRAKNPPLSTAIIQTTFVTTLGDVTGTYGDDGSISLPDVPVHLQERFFADFIVTLTTGEVNIPSATLPIALLDDGGFPLSVDRTKIRGSVIDPETKQVKLVGISTFTNAGGTAGPVKDTIGGSAGAVLIEATINTP